MKWTKEIPKEAGLWWFYGECENLTIGKPELNIVQVMPISNGIIYWMGLRQGAHENGFNGVWQKVTIPESPEQESGGKEGE